jgi:hypothetical protein
MSKKYRRYQVKTPAKDSQMHRHVSYQKASQPSLAPLLVLNTTTYPMTAILLSVLLLSSARRVDAMRISDTDAPLHTHTPPMKTAVSDNAVVCQTLSPLPISPVSAVGFQENALTFFGFPVKNITDHVIECRPKNQGANAGKICSLDDQQHYALKEIKPVSHLHNPPSALNALYNLHLIEKYIGAKVPETHFFFERNSFMTSYKGTEYKDKALFMASKFIDNIEYLDIKDFDEVILKVIAKRQQNRREFRMPPMGKKKDNGDMISQTITKKFKAAVESDEIAKFAVVISFMKDIVDNTGNWGIVNRKIVIIDGDLSPKSVKDYLETAEENWLKMPFALSFNDLLKMNKIYERMSEMPAPKIHPFVDMPEASYQALLATYVEVTQRCIYDLFQQGMGMAVMRDTPLAEINKMLSEALEPYNGSPHRFAEKVAGGRGIHP